MSEDFRFKIMPDSGDEFEVAAGMRDIRLWEKLHKGRSLGMFSDPVKMSATLLFELAYSACKRQSKLPGTMTGDQFADAYDIEMLEEEPATELTAEYEALRVSLLGNLSHEQAYAAALAAQQLDDESEAPDPLSTHPEA